MPSPSRPWFLHHISDVIGSQRRSTQVLLPTTAAGYVETWVRAIGEPLPWTRRPWARLRGAIAVLTGRAVALQWPKDGELELALFGPIPEPLREAVQAINAGDAA